MVVTEIPMTLRRSELANNAPKKLKSPYVEDLHADVVMLLDVLARIETRRQARLRNEQQSEVN